MGVGIYFKIRENYPQIKAPDVVFRSFMFTYFSTVFFPSTFKGDKLPDLQLLFNMNHNKAISYGRKLYNHGISDSS
jgi:hypothetical protein